MSLLQSIRSLSDLQNAPAFARNRLFQTCFLLLLVINTAETLAAYGFWLWHPHAAAHQFFTDFKTFYGCARVWLDGLDPYDQKLVETYLVQHRLLEPGTYNFFLYPPAALYLFTPLALMPYDAAALLAGSIGLACLGAGIGLWLRTFRDSPLMGWAALYLAVGPWNTANVLQGQIFNLLAFLLISVLLTTPRRGWALKLVLAFTAGTLVAAKPSLLMPLVVAALAAERVRILYIAMGIGLVLYVLAAFLAPGPMHGYLNTMAGLPHLFLPWHGQVSDFAVYTNQSLNGLTACLDKGLILKLPQGLSEQAGIALRVTFYTVWAILAGITGWFMLGQVLRLFKRPRYLGAWEEAFAAQSPYFRAVFFLLAVYLDSPVSWVAYTVFVVPPLVALALRESKSPHSVVGWILLLVSLRLNYVSDNLIRALVHRHSATAMVELAGIEVYRSIIGLCLLFLWLRMMRYLWRISPPRLG